MKRYVIHKSTREPGDVSYDGPTWDQAGIRGHRQNTYHTRKYAELIARDLSRVNPVGFKVAEIDVKDETE